jgi:hypothetical protein
MNENAPAMSAGGAGDPGHVQNATDNYAAEVKNKSQFRQKMAVKMAKRNAPK